MTKHGKYLMMVNTKCYVFNEYMRRPIPKLAFSRLTYFSGDAKNFFSITT